MRFLSTIYLSILAASAFAAEVPIQIRDGLVWTQVQGNSRTLNFVIDTGAASTVVSLDAARALGLKLGVGISVAGVRAQTRGYKTSNFAGAIAGIDLPREVIALDLRSPSRACSQAINGLIGADFFKGKVVQLDYAHSVMRCLDRAVLPTANSLPLKFQNGVICVPVALNGSTPRWTRLDTGCTDELHWSLVGTKWSRKAAPLSVALSASASSHTRLPVQLGMETLDNIPVTLHARQIFPNEAGLLGNGMLSKFRVTIDAVKNRLTLER